MSTPVRFVNGISTQPVFAFGGDFPLPHPFSSSARPTHGVAVYADDFLDLGNTTSRTIVGASSTLALTDEVGGVALITPGAATTVTTVHRTAAALQFQAGNRLWCQHRMAVSSVAGAVVVQVGLSKVSAGTIATTDRLYIEKAAGSTSLNLISVVNNVSTTLLTAFMTGMANATYYNFGLYYDGKDLEVYVNDNLMGRVAAVTIGASATNLTNALMAPYVNITPTASETIKLDYLMAAQELPR